MTLNKFAHKGKDTITYLPNHNKKSTATLPSENPTVWSALIIVIFLIYKDHNLLGQLTATQQQYTSVERQKRNKERYRLKELKRKQQNASKRRKVLKFQEEVWMQQMMERDFIYRGWEKWESYHKFPSKMLFFKYFFSISASKRRNISLN